MSDARISADDLGMSDELNETTAVSLKVQYFTNMVLFQIGSDIQRRAQKFENCPFSRLLFSETAGNSFKCWAFATASMIRSTLRDAVSKSKRIPELEKAAIYESIKAINHKVNLFFFAKKCAFIQALELKKVLVSSVR